MQFGCYRAAVALAQDITRTETSNLLEPSENRGLFAELLEPGENVLWRERTLPPPALRALEEVARGEIFERHARLDVGALDLTELLQPVSNRLARRFLEDDITALARAFGAMLGRRHVHGQLAVLRHDACAKFHSDNVTVRLLCTYAGPGTEWIRNEDVVRHNLARTDVDLETANRSVLRVSDAIRRVAAGDVLLLKGEAFAGNRGSGAVHRSPPIAAQGLRRLVFKIDEQPCGC
jgi:hypothetical protein